MKQTILRVAAATIAATLFLSVQVAATPSVSARSALVMDAATGRVLYEKNADQKSLIASTTKMMTGLLVAESGKLDRRLSVPAEAVGIEGSSLYLKQGELLTVQDLLYGLMLHSGNDAAVALAIATAGTVERFVGLMNEKAKELGLGSTHFANPNGLDDEGNYSTARDLAKLASAAMENDVFRQVTSTKEIKVGQRFLHNHNKLLWRYDGAVGIKTGFTKKAGRLLVSAAERDGRRLVAVTINAPDDWRDHAAMLDYGFSQFSVKTLVESGQQLGSMPIISGMDQELTCYAQDGLDLALLPGEEAQLRLILPRFAFAPIQADAPAGMMEVQIKGKTLATVPLLWTASTDEKFELPKQKSLLERLFGG